MAHRMQTRASAAAAALLGLTVAGIGMASSAQADPITVTQTYSCSTWALGVGDQGTNEVEVELTSDLPSQVQVGDEITVPISASVAISPDRHDLLYNALGVRSIVGFDDRGNPGLNALDAYNHALYAIELGGTTTDGEIALTVPKTVVPAPSEGPLLVAGSGTSAAFVADAAGTATVSAGDFQAYIRTYTGDDLDGEFKTTVAMTCTNISADKTVGTIEVVAAEPTATPTTDEPTSTPTTTDEPTSTPTTTDEPTSTPTTTSEPTATTDDDDDDVTVTATASGPQTPGVVQTDDRAVGTSPLLLGGLTLAGAGAAALFAARRRMGGAHR